MLPKGHDYHSDTAVSYDFDPQKANKLLDEAGFTRKQNKRFNLTLTITNNSTRYAIAKVLANNFKDLGIQLRIRTVEWGKFKQDVEKGVVDAWLLTWIGFKDPDIYRYAFATASVPPHGGNRGWYSDKNLDELLNKGLLTHNKAARQKIYQEVTEHVTKNLPYIFLFHENNFAVIRKNVKNFKLFADGHYSSLSKVEKF